MTTALQSLDAFIAPGWTPNFGGGYEFGFGYYLHRGYVYISGFLESTPTSTQTLLTGLPPGIAPVKAVAATLIVMPEVTDDPRNPALELPTSYASTIHPDGKWTLDAPLPPQVTVTPTEEAWWYYSGPVGGEYTRHPQYVAPLLLGIVLGGPRWALPGTPPPDAFVALSLAPYLYKDFEDIDSLYAIHGSRIHLAGHVRAAKDRPKLLLTNVGPADDDLGLRVPPRSNFANFGGQSTEAESLGGKATGVLLNSDEIAPAGDDPPLGVASPANSAGEFGKEVGERNFSTEGVGENPQNGNGQQGGVNTVGYGFSECKWQEGEPGLGWFYFNCNKSGATPGAFTFDLTALLAQCSPTPDWFAVELVVSYAATPGTSGICPPEHTPEHPHEFPGCPPNLPRHNNPGLAGAVLCDSEGEEKAIPPDTEEATGGFNGFLKPPASLYKGTKLTAGITPDPSVLWTPAQAGTVITITSPAGEVNSATLEYELRITPFYNKRQIGLRKGDVLDLGGTGWYGTLDGVTLIGPQRGGIVPRPRLQSPGPAIPSRPTVGKRG